MTCLWYAQSVGHTASGTRSQASGKGERAWGQEGPLGGAKPTSQDRGCFCMISSRPGEGVLPGGRHGARGISFKYLPSVFLHEQVWEWERDISEWVDRNFHQLSEFPGE